MNIIYIITKETNDNLNCNIFEAYTFKWFVKQGMTRGKAIFKLFVSMSNRVVAQLSVRQSTSKYVLVKKLKKVKKNGIERSRKK